jgi:hypothetical protein
VAAKRDGFKGLTEVAGLTDEQAQKLVLGNWHVLNPVLASKPGVPALQRLTALELQDKARPDILERLRAALSNALGRAAEKAMARLLDELGRGVVELSLFDMVTVGLNHAQAMRVNAERKRLATARSKPLTRKAKGKKK